jgi:hypothetical protein
MMAGEDGSPRRQTYASFTLFTEVPLRNSAVEVTEYHYRFCVLDLWNVASKSRTIVILMVADLQTFYSIKFVVACPVFMGTLRYKPVGRGFDSRWCY